MRLTKKTFALAFALLAFIGTAYAATTYSVVNSNGQYPLYNEGSTKTAALRAFIMRYNPCGYDCGPDVCTRVHQPSGMSCPYIVKAKACKDVQATAQTGWKNRQCTMQDQFGGNIGPAWMYYTLHNMYPVWFNGNSQQAGADLNAQTFTTVF